MMTVCKQKMIMNDGYLLLVEIWR